MLAMADPIYDILFDFGIAGPLRLFIVQGPDDQNGDPVWCVFAAFACWNAGITSGEGVAARNINTGGAIMSAGRGAGKTTKGSLICPEFATLDWTRRSTNEHLLPLRESTNALQGF